MKVLGETSFHHFCQNEADFEGKHDRIEFPVRDPLATSVSWRAYQSDRTDMDEFRRWETAIDYLSRHPHKVFRIEDFPVLEGRSSDEWWFKQALKRRDLETLKKLPEVRYLLEWIERPEIAAFFKAHYPEGFWWQSN